jgi:glutamine---fructose-6-phosphate transaminase (isomerizing)
MTTRCVRCLLPSTYPDVTFDEEGVCNHCAAYRELPLLGEERLLERLRSRPSKDYDCVIGISGGKDSCYVAYLARKRLGLRPLAVCYDFPFMVDLARENIRAVCESLDVPLLVVKSRNNVEYSLMRDHFMSLAATGTTWGQCMFCHYGIHAILYRTAKSRGIPFILSGVTRNEVWWDPGSRLGILAKRLKQLPLREKALFGLYQAQAYAHLVDQRRQFPLPGNNCFDAYRRENTPQDGPIALKVFDYLEWDQPRIEKTLQEETGWRKPDRSLSWRYDCILEPLLDVTFYREFGISSAGLYLCGMVRGGELGREEALRLMEESEDRARLDASLKAVLDYLEIPALTQAKFFSATRN